MKLFIRKNKSGYGGNEEKMENAIVVKNLTKRYKDFTLNNVSFQVPTGSVVGFIGENGAGKSTTIQAILGIIAADAGEIELLGHKVERKKADETWREQVGVVFDECNFHWELKIKYVRNILKNIYRTWDDGKFLNYLKKFELPPDKKIKELSKGMKMKLSIAAALSHDSRVLILDEATSGLDPVIRNEILDIFRELIEDGEHTIFISSHITSDIEKISDYVMLIHRGELLLSENKDEILYNYAIVRCSKEQADLIPRDIVVGREENAYEVSVLVKDKNRLLKSSFEEQAQRIGGSSFAIDKAGVEDVLLYVARERDGGRK
ncbi:MAG: ABC transporter ATP-binding protein [Clostridium sp.]|nr:ABC transporter ATP-binding protein [Clostridium sp.]